MMKDDHIEFGQISDLLDNLVSTEEEKELILNHIDVCPECRLEYEQLRSTIKMVSQLGRIEYDLGTISIDTVSIYRSRKRKAYMIKSLPAIAASLLIIAGGSVLTTNFMTPVSPGMNFAENGQRNVSETEKIVNIIRDSNGRILKVSDLFIEGEVSPEKFDRLRRSLGFRKVVHTRIFKSGAGIAKSSFSPKKNIEEVSLGGVRKSSNTEALRDSAHGSGSFMVRFRVFR